MSKKWENRTKALVTKWPKGGTWDVAVCGEMETLIKYHKANKNTERRKKKRRKELEVLRLFKVKGETRRRDQKAMRKALSEKEEMRQKEIWPPSYQSQYPLVEAPPPSYKGQFPVIEGKVEFKGEVTQKDQAGSEQKGTASCLDGYREVSALLRQAMEEGLRGSELITEGQEKEKAQKEDTDQEEPVIFPGDKVYLRVFRRKWHEPQREGPFKVTRATATAVQVEGSNTWYHLNHCTRVLHERQIVTENDTEDAAALGSDGPDGGPRGAPQLGVEPVSGSEQTEGQEGASQADQPLQTGHEAVGSGRADSDDIGDANDISGPSGLGAQQDHRSGEFRTIDFTDSALSFDAE
ncbi:uncharacterized protein LOC125715434 [Brienomyrus brachyistius]|uniref:uncharacterized protein LOC125715434 n=1 Tax=Brienomyrus brachyistius TaxID=42636 RepID=UPI0020B4598B|nr:uncharacterized protein LOC125715434 [Brienomyrus brachyistius]